MIILKTPGIDGYSLLDSGKGYRLEKFGPYTIARPDPQAIWERNLNEQEWEKADAIFESNGEKGNWVFKQNLPHKWIMNFDNISFWVKLTPFKHTGVFPEQIIQWNWVKEKIEKENRQLQILNLFGYTGIASLVCAKAGAKVTHVDASRPTIAWARDNQTASKLLDKPIRWILDDAIKFVQREIKRGVKYDGIIMDPPVYGHGPNGEKWNFTESFPLLFNLCQQVLCEKPTFLLINAYALSSSSLMLENILKDFQKKFGGIIEAGELALEEQNSTRLLSTGIFGRWSKQ